MHRVWWRMGVDSWESVGIRSCCFCLPYSPLDPCTRNFLQAPRRGSLFIAHTQDIARILVYPVDEEHEYNQSLLKTMQVVVARNESPGLSTCSFLRQRMHAMQWGGVAKQCQRQLGQRETGLWPVSEEGTLTAGRSGTCFPLPSQGLGTGLQGPPLPFLDTSRVPRLQGSPAPWAL